MGVETANSTLRTRLPTMRSPLLVLVLSGVMTTASADDRESGDFKPLFNGTDLTDWDGDPRFWRVTDGVLIGQTTAENKAEKNTFLIYRGGEFSDFDLQFDYQVTGFNSGMQYRSQEKGKGEWSIGGYQADFEAQWHNGGKTDKFSGMFFDEQGRMFMGQRGDVVIVTANDEKPKKPHLNVVGSVGDPAELEKAIKRDDWNSYRIIADGHHFTHIINGQVMSVGIDHDDINFKPSGLIAVQLHSGPPMQIKLRNIRIRELHP